MGDGSKEGSVGHSATTQQTQRRKAPQEHSRVRLSLLTRRKKPRGLGCTQTYRPIGVFVKRQTIARIPTEGFPSGGLPFWLGARNGAGKGNQGRFPWSRRDNATTPKGNPTSGISAWRRVTPSS